MLNDIPIIEKGEGGYWAILSNQKTFHKYEYLNKMEITIQSKYVKAGENIQKDDVVIIKDEGSYREGKFGPQLELQLELADGTVKSYTPSVQTQLNMIQEYGKDSKNWIDKRLKAWVYDDVKKGKVTKKLILTPEDWEEPVKEKDTDEVSGDNMNIKDLS